MPRSSLLACSPPWRRRHGGSASTERRSRPTSSTSRSTGSSRATDGCRYLYRVSTLVRAFSVDAPPSRRVCPGVPGARDCRCCGRRVWGHVVASTRVCDDDGGVGLGIGATLGTESRPCVGAVTDVVGDDTCTGLDTASDVASSAPKKCRFCLRRVVPVPAAMAIRPTVTSVSGFAHGPVMGSVVAAKTGPPRPTRCLRSSSGRSNTPVGCPRRRPRSSFRPATQRPTQPRRPADRGPRRRRPDPSHSYSPTSHIGGLRTQRLPITARRRTSAAQRRRRRSCAP